MNACKRLAGLLRVGTTAKAVARWVAGLPGIVLCLAGLSVAGLSGCASTWNQPLHGEQAAYHVFNAGNDAVIVMPELLSEDRHTRLYANLQATRPARVHDAGAPWVWGDRATAKAPLPALPFKAYDAFGSPLPGPLLTSSAFERDPGEFTAGLPQRAPGSFQQAPGPHRVPHTVWLKWRQAPNPGLPDAQGEPVGPVRVLLRDRIPPDVLERLRESWRYRIDVAIGARLDEPEVVWRLMRTTDRGVEVVSRSVDAWP